MAHGKEQLKFMLETAITLLAQDMLSAGHSPEQANYIAREAAPSLVVIMLAFMNSRPAAPAPLRFTEPSLN